MKSVKWILLCCCLFEPVCAQNARELIESSGFTGGVIVHLGCGDGKLTADLLVNDRCLVHGLDTDAKNVEKAREHIKSRDLYGRVSVMKFNGRTLPYADNLINLLIAEKLGKISVDEVMRVLVPKGAAYVKKGPKWEKIVKPWPSEIDQWSHYLHGPDNNAVADDAVVGPPRYLQWIQEPKSDRHHDSIGGFRAVVSAGGRIFSIEDEGPVELPYWPGEWYLKARDAFNGLLLWKVPIPQWEPVSRPHRTGPVQQPRRLVAAPDRVFVTLGLHEPVSALDAATGEVLKTYKGTEKTQEILFEDGVLYLVVGDPTYPTGLSYLIERSKRYKHDTDNDPSIVEGPVCSIVAIDADSGKTLWAKSGTDTKGYKAMSLAVRGSRAAFLNETHLVCVQKATGRQLWHVPRTTTIKNPGTPPVVVMTDQAIYAADGKSLAAFSLKDGKQLWNTASREAHPVSAPNIFIAAGLVWPGYQSGGLDPLTGERREAIGSPHKDTMSHHRCYRDKATVRYLLAGGNGVEFLPLGTTDDISHNFVRGTCQYGVVPCNGLLYATPDNCECNRSVKLNSYLALAAENQGSEVITQTALEKGPAYGKAAGTKPQIREPKPGEWPMFRHDTARGGATKSAVSKDLARAWQVKLAGRLSQPVVADGKIFVSVIDAHTVYALDPDDGKVAWSYTAGARVDSPPVIYRGLALFGSTDGWVYCLRAFDGALVWRFRAAPSQRLVGAWEQLESAWPIHGSVLIVEDTLYLAAGRSTFLDGGIYLYGLDPVTGQKRYEYLFSGPWDETQRHQVVRSVGRKDVEGGLSDILASDGSLLYLRNNAFDLTCKPVKDGIKPHLFASAGFLDDSWNHRTAWMVDTALRYGGTPQFYPQSGQNDTPQGEILTLDGKDLYGFKAYPMGRHSVFDPRESGYILFAGTIAQKAKAAEPVEKTTRRGKSAAKKRSKGKSDSSFGYSGKWLVYIQATARGMVKAGDILFVAGTPNIYDPKDPAGAIRGRKGGVLLAISAADGSELARYKLDSPPVFDGLIAANGKLYMSLRDGSLACWSP